jgi:hypothetical protein
LFAKMRVKLQMLTKVTKFVVFFALVDKQSAV